ncbi:MAG: hypothetical protein DRO23_06000 [Thermoprotei archaeon]|nr:MAG: hypothetical protein DRO23_06000 [Thermoprotei archaeon]
MVSKAVKCTTCSIRQAVYYRRESGEKLCLQCLEKSIVRQVKHEINKWKMLEPHDTIGFLIPIETLLISIPAFKIMSIIERKYATELFLIKPKELKGVVFDVEKVVEYQLPRRPKTITELLRLERVEAAKISDKHGINKIIVPHTLEFEVTYFLMNILEFNFAALSDLNPKMYSEKYGVLFTKPFRKVKSYEILLYGYLKGLLSEVHFSSIISKYFTFDNCCKLGKYLDYIITLGKRHFELLISTLKMSELFIEKILPEYGFRRPCLLCGALAKNKLCNVCSTLYFNA